MSNHRQSLPGDSLLAAVPPVVSAANVGVRAFDRELDADNGAAEVLVVDDEPANLQAVEAALEGLEIRILSVTSGHDALRELLRHNVALILLDVRLPSFSGFDTARLIRLRTRSRHVPIIFLTAHNQNPEDIRKGYELGAVDYLFKPFAPEVLRAKVQAFVELRNRTAEVRAQATQLRALEREAGERRLQEARREWEANALRHQMAEQRKLNAQLEDADRRKDEFLAVLAHELRNPLAPLVAGLEFIQLQQADPSTVGKVCDAMNRQVHHLVRLVDDLLDLSRITRGKVELQRDRIDVRACVEQAVETCLPAAQRVGHELLVSLAAEPLVCEADRVRVTQIVNNLLSNAVRYTSPGGRIEIEAVAEDDAVVIRVRDNGKGIAEDMLERIFDTFVQEQIGDSGLGLGLTLVKEVVTMHGGTVKASSEGRGKGSEFEVRLPRLLDAVALVADEGKPARDEGASLRVLIVEDQLDIGETTQALLEAWGHQVHLAHDGREGIELATSLRPDVVLLDIGLPDMDGYGVAARIRDELGAARPRLVAVTGFGQARDRARAQEAGFDEHLVKPAQPDALRDTLSRVQAAVSREVITQA